MTEAIPEEAKQRVLNTLSNRIEQEFGITVIGTETGAFSPDGGNTYNACLYLEESPPDLDEFQETISNYEYLYNKTEYWTRARYSFEDSLPERATDSSVKYHVHIDTL